MEPDGGCLDPQGWSSGLELKYLQRKPCAIRASVSDSGVNIDDDASTEDNKERQNSAKLEYMSKPQRVFYR